MSEIYLVGRSAFSDNAKLFARYLGKSIVAYEMLSSSSYVCTKQIVEMSGYKQLLRFYQWLSRATQEEVQMLIKKYNPFRYVFFPEMDAETFQNRLMDFPKPAIESAMRKYVRAQKESILAEDFIEECRRAYLTKIEDEVDKDSEWYGCPPVLDVVTSTECPHHENDVYCYMIRKERDSDPMLDPMFDETLENLRALEEELQQEFFSG